MGAERDEPPFIMDVLIMGAVGGLGGVCAIVTGGAGAGAGGAAAGGCCAMIAAGEVTTMIFVD